ncbi:MAG: hypothetical protein NZ528_13025 [Caldilineales bacterium]|nr:hypothetical protein [Caldilineales bacterium]MDW8317492.1 hypothetical protein [Anaerolineae bacterium]
MNSINEQSLHSHVQIIGWLRIISAVFYGLLGVGIAAFLFVIGVYASSEAGDPTAFLALLIGAIVMALVLLPWALLCLLAGVGLLRRRAWGRYLALVVGALDLFNFPLGTLLGVYSLYILLQKSADAYFVGGV